MTLIMTIWMFRHMLTCILMDLSCTAPMNPYIWDNSRIIRDTEEESLPIRMDQFTKASGPMTNPMALDNIKC